MTSDPAHLLSIGEFSAATQLTPKALRLYDEQRLMLPATTDSANGYRYYRNDQVPVGRLIRTLREMNLSLAQISAIVTMPGRNTEMLLQSFSQEIDRRYAREKRAFQAALMLLRDPMQSLAPNIDEFSRDEMAVSVHSFTADRGHFVERFATEQRRIREDATRAGLSPSDVAYCRLIDPLSDEEGRLEVLLPIVVAGPVPPSFTIRTISSARCATVVASTTAHAAELTASLDSLFDWFDRHGYHAIDTPWVSVLQREHGAVTKIIWAYESRPKTSI